MQAKRAVHYLRRFYPGFWVETERQGVCNWVDVGGAQVRLSTPLYLYITAGKNGEIKVLRNSHLD